MTEDCSNADTATADLGRATARAAEHADADVKRHLALMPQRYVRTATVQTVRAHAALAAGRGRQTVALQWRDLPGGSCSELTVVARDAPRLFSCIASTLTANGVDILSVELFSRRDGVAIQAYRVAERLGDGPVSEERRTRVGMQLRGLVSGGTRNGDAVERWRAAGAEVDAAACARRG